MRSRKPVATSSIPKPLLYRISAAQLLVLLLVAAALYSLDSLVAFAWILGGLVQVIPSAYFGFYAFRYRGARATHSLLQSMYRGEVGKFVLTLLGFAFAFSSPARAEAIWIFAAYGAMALVHCIGSRYVVK